MRNVFTALEEQDPDIVEVTVVDAEREVQEHDAELVEQLGEINEGLDAVSEAFVAIESMLSISAGLERAINKEEGISAATAAIAKVSTEHICDLLGYTRNKPIVPALEAFNETSGLEATKYTLEGISDFIQDTWDAIVRFFSNIKDYIVNLWKGIVDANQRKKNLIEKYLEKLETIDTEGWAPLEPSDVKKRFDSSSGKILGFQNSFRLKTSSIIDENISKILNNQVAVTSLDLKPVLDSVSFDSNNGSPDIADSIIKLRNLLGKVNTNQFIDGWTLVSKKSNNGKVDIEVFEQSVKKTTSVSPRNKDVTNTSDIRSWLELCDEIVDNMNDASDYHNEYKKILTDFANDIRDYVAKNRNTLSAEDKTLHNEGITVTMGLKNIVDVAFVKMPSLSAATVSKVLEYISFQMNFYKKSSD